MLRALACTLTCSALMACSGGGQGTAGGSVGLTSVTLDGSGDMSSGTGSDSRGAPTTTGGSGAGTSGSATSGVGTSSGAGTETGGGASTDPSGDPGPSCGDLATASGWPGAACEWNGNGACAGHGPATADCDHCCSGSDCAVVQAAAGWHASLCDVGCDGEGTPTTDCSACCAGPSCGELAAAQGWGDDALCEQNGDGICKGTGQPTYDCERCCDGGGVPKSAGFGFPVGDLGTFPAGGWSIGQVMAHYLDGYGGRHLAHDVSHPGGGAATVDALVFAVADGLVRYAGPNNSQYKHIVLIEHTIDGEDPVCSFYGHINAPVVATGQMVKRGDPVTSVMNWDLISPGDGSGNTHLHYGIVRKSLCDASAAANGALICGYDKGGPNGVVDLASEPYSYQPVGDVCGDSGYGDVFISPAKFIADHHF
jgi:hypothetical protein